MTKIGIITILKVNNYGAELQAYATQRVLNNLRWKAEIIDYLFYKNPNFRKTAMAKPLFPVNFNKRLKEWLYPVILKLKELKAGEVSKTRKERFVQFHKAHTVMSRTYHSMDELYQAKLDYDVYVVGSDQVWNPGNYSSLNPYFLTFAPMDKKRISYASSFGVSEIPQNALPFYRKHLSELSSISVRENTAVGLVRRLCGRDAQWVLDPTLLLGKSEWLQVSSNRYNMLGSFVLIYELTPCPYIVELASYISKEKQLNIVRICKSAAKEDKDDSVYDIIDAGPAEFLELFAKASYVVTNSFHGTAFSINFEKLFYTVIPDRKNNNSRQLSLLEMVGLKNRMIVENGCYPDLDSTIDYLQVAKKLTKEREQSISYLKKAIDGE